jgi:hypothetical protein
MSLISLLLSVVAFEAFAQPAAGPLPTAKPPSDAAVAFVTKQPLPANPVQLSETVEVGKPVPSNLVLSPIPEATNHAFVVVNQEKLIVDPETRIVLQIVK